MANWGFAVTTPNGNYPVRRCSTLCAKANVWTMTKRPCTESGSYGERRGNGRWPHKPCSIKKDTKIAIANTPAVCDKTTIGNANTGFRRAWSIIYPPIGNGRMRSMRLGLHCTKRDKPNAKWDE